MSVHFPSLFQSSRTDILDLLLNAEEVDPGSGGLADSVTQLLSINMESDTQELQDKSGKAEENGVKKKKKKKGLTTEASPLNNWGFLEVNPPPSKHYATHSISGLSSISACIHVQVNGYVQCWSSRGQQVSHQR